MISKPVSSVLWCSWLPFCFQVPTLSSSLTSILYVVWLEPLNQVQPFLPRLLLNIKLYHSNRKWTRSDDLWGNLPHSSSLIFLQAFETAVKINMCKVPLTPITEVLSIQAAILGADMLTHTAETVMQALPLIISRCLETVIQALPLRILRRLERSVWFQIRKMCLKQAYF